jgi:hypothetical protein
MKIGYREGITNGKELSLQEGFNAGFAQIGAPLGRRVGTLRGIINALGHFFQASEASALLLEDLQKEGIEQKITELGDRLNRIRLKDLSPLDLDERKHASEHRDVDAEGTDDALADSMMALEAKERPDGVTELADIEQEVQFVLQRVNLTNILSS